MYLEILKQEEVFSLQFWSLNDMQKGTTNAFSIYKLTTKLCLDQLDVKLQQNRCGYCFTIKNARKRQKFYISRETNIKQGATVVLDVKLVEKKFEQRFKTLQINKNATTHVFSV